MKRALVFLSAAVGALALAAGVIAAVERLRDDRPSAGTAFPLGIEPADGECVGLVTNTPAAEAAGAPSPAAAVARLEVSPKGLAERAVDAITKLLERVVDGRRVLAFEARRVGTHRQWFVTKAAKAHECGDHSFLVPKPSPRGPLGPPAGPE